MSFDFLSTKIGNRMFRDYIMFQNEIILKKSEYPAIKNCTVFGTN